MSGKSSRIYWMSYLPMVIILGFILLWYATLLAVMIPEFILGARKSKVLNLMYPWSGIVNLVIFHVFFFVAMLCFVLSSCTSPGSVPPLSPWDPECLIPIETTHSDFRGVERKANGCARFCRSCGKYKPDRTHHSRHTAACILEMDHYCPWVRNTIGYRNKKYFLLLVLYSSLALMTYCVTIGPYLAFRMSPFRNLLISDVLVIFCMVCTGIFSVILTCFFIFHCWLMACNYTTIEYCEKRNAADGKRDEKGERIKNMYKTSPYDLGVYQNLKHFLGPYPILWLIPTRLGFDDSPLAGCVFQVNQNHPLYKQEHKLLLRRSASYNLADKAKMEQVVEEVTMRPERSCIRNCCDSKEPETNALHRSDATSDLLQKKKLEAEQKPLI